MKKNKLKILALFACILAVLVGVLFVVKARSAAYEEAQEVRYDTLYDLTANKIARIAWKTSDGTEYAFARKDGSWVYELDETFAVNQSACNTLASGMTGVSVYQAIPDVTDLAQYGLDEPAYTISVTDTDGNEKVTLIGNNNTTAGSVYAIYEDDPKTVFSVQPSIKSAVEKTLADFELADDSSVSE